MNSKLLNIIDENEVEAILITNKYDITYVSGFTGDEAYVLMTKTSCYIIADTRYVEQAKKQCDGFNVVLMGNGEPDLPNLLEYLISTNNIKKLGIDVYDIKHRLYTRVIKKLENVEIVDLEAPFKEKRMIKTPDEIQKIRRAAEIADSSYYRMLQMIWEGMSEKDIEIELEYTIKREGGDEFAFAPIIGAGSKTSMPYSWPDKNVLLKKGDMLLLNYGVKYEGYSAVIARMVAIGSAKEEYRDIYSNMYEVYVSILDSVRPYMKYEELYEIFTDKIKSSKYKNYFLAAIGHGRGLQTIEGYSIRPEVKRTIYPNEVYSIGVSIAVPDLGGARLEDAVLINEKGTENLTNSVRNLLNI